MDINVLIVDDDIGARETLSDIFSEKGYAVATAGSARGAFEEAEKRVFELALIDIKLPDMDGVELLKELKSLHPQMLAVIVTGHASRENAILALKSGADDYFLKPLDIDEVLRRTGLALEKIDLAKKLVESEEKFRCIFESSTDAIMLLENDKFIDCNDTTLEVFGLKSKDDFLGKHPGELSPLHQAEGRDSIEAANERMAAALEKGNNSFEWIHIRSDGRPFPAEVILTTLCLEGRTLIQATVRDITEKKRAKDDLERLFNLSGSMACIINFDGFFTRVSPAFSEVLGYSAEELLSRPVMDFIHPDDRENTLRAREERLKMGFEILDFENRYICRDGSTKWLSWTSRPIPADEVILAIAYDITSRKYDEMAFETLVKTTAKSTGQEFFEGLVSELSRWLGVECCAVCELDGTRARALALIHDGEYIKDFEYDLAGSPCEKVVDGGYCVFEEGVTKLFPQDHILKDLKAEGYVGIALKSRDGAPIGLLNALSLTPLQLPPRADEVFAIMGSRAAIELERIIADRALSESEEMMRAISETAQDAIIIINDYGKVIYWNPAAIEIFGYSEDEALGMPFTDLIVMEGAREGLLKKLAEFRQTGECEMIGKTVEMRALKKDGTVFPIEHSISAVTLKGRQFAIGIMKDITWRKVAEEKLTKEVEITRNLLKITEATAHSENLEDLMEEIVSAVGTIAASDISMIYVRDSETSLMLPVSASGIEPYQIPSFRTNPIDPELAIVRECFKDGPVFISDLSESPFSWLNDITSLAVIPLKGKKVFSGFLIQAYRDKAEAGGGLRNGFTEKEMSLFLGIGHHVTLAIEKAARAKEAIDRTMELSHKIETIEVMHEIDKTILSTLDPMAIRRTVVNMVARLVPCERSTVRLVNSERGGFVFAAGFGVDDEVESEIVPFNETSALEVVESRRPQYISNLSKIKDPLPFEQKLLEAGYLSHIRVPLIVKSEITGVLHLASRHPAAFVPEDLAVLDKLSTQIVMALENSRLVTDLEQLLISTIKTLSDVIDAKSPWTRGHSERVTAIALRIGRKMGLAEKRLKRFEIAGLLHDIGKIGTYENILNKPDKLTVEETAELQKHSTKGAEILANISQLGDIVPVVRHHHEFFDGTGYPDGRKGKDIPLEARILSVADTVDAMASDRPYRKGLPVSIIIEELKKCSALQFDPEIVRVCLEILGDEDLETSGLLPTAPPSPLI